MKKPHGDCVMDGGEGGVAAGFDAVAGGFNEDAKRLLVCKVHHLALTPKHIQAAALQTETRIGKVILVRRSVDGIAIRVEIETLRSIVPTAEHVTERGLKIKRIAEASAKRNKEDGKG